MIATSEEMARALVQSYAFKRALALDRDQLIPLIAQALDAYAAAPRERAITAIMLAGVSSRLVAEALFDQASHDPD